MLTTRPLRFKVYSQNGEPMPNVTVKARLSKITVIPEGVVVPSSYDDFAITDENGDALVQVYAGISAYYDISYPCLSSIETTQVLVPAGTDEIVASTLQAATVIDGDAAAIAQLQTYVDQKITEAVLGSGATAQNVGFNPTGDIEATNLHDAVSELDSEKLSRTDSFLIDPVLLFENALI